MIKSPGLSTPIAANPKTGTNFLSLFARAGWFPDAAGVLRSWVRWARRLSSRRKVAMQDQGRRDVDGCFRTWRLRDAPGMFAGMKLPLMLLAGMLVLGGCASQKGDADATG